MPDTPQTYIEVRWVESRGFTETGRKQRFEEFEIEQARTFAGRKREKNPAARMVRVTVEDIV